MPRGRLSAGVVLDDRYRVECFLGRGGMCTVFKAVHEQLGKTVALKLLHENLIQDEEAVLRFQREAAAVAQLQHRNIVSASGFGVVNGQPYIALEFVEGESLSEIVRRDGALAEEKFVDIVTQICDGVGEAHKEGIIHRDLKPSNVMIVQDGVVKVVDFGIAKILPQDGKQLQKLTQTGDIFGSLPYMSPEQCSGSEVGPPSDVYALGCTMYEMLTGKPAFYAESPYSLLRKQTDEMPERDPKLGKFVDLVFACLQKDPAVRPQSMQAVADRLAAPDAVPAHAPRKTQVPHQDKYRISLWTSIAIFIIVGLGMALYMLLMQAETQQLASEYQSAERLYKDAEFKFHGDETPEARLAFASASNALGQYIGHARRLQNRSDNVRERRRIYDAETMMVLCTRELKDRADEAIWLKELYSSYEPGWPVEPLLDYAVQLVGDYSTNPSSAPHIYEVLAGVHENISTLGPYNACRARTLIVRLCRDQKPLLPAQKDYINAVIKEKQQAKDSDTALQECERLMEEQHFDAGNYVAQEAAQSADQEGNDYNWCLAKTYMAEALMQKKKFGESHDRAEEVLAELERLNLKRDPLYQKAAKIKRTDDEVLEMRNSTMF